MKTTGRKTIRAKASAPKSVKAAEQATARATAIGGGSKGAPTVEEIARRSYELYLARGAQPGHEREDWLAAESELLGK